MKIVVLASLAYSLSNFRGALLAAMVRAGHEVVACAPDDSPETVAALAAIGVRYRRIAMQRVDRNPFGDIRTVASLVGMLREERPDTLLAYTQKPIIYGGIAARIVGGIRFHAMVSGLGYVFTDDGRSTRRLLRTVVAALYRIGVARARTVFVFNGDDAAEMRRWRMIGPRHAVIQVPGSGVDTTRHPGRPVPAGPPVFLMIARLLRDKGLAEYAAAARVIRERHPGVRFQLLGPLDANPTSVTRAELDGWAADVEYLGETRDVMPYLAAASVFVLPTYYREGLPRTILEAMATGRAIVTTDTPGCRETVEPGANGFLVPVRDAAALARTLEQFVVEPALASRLGARSRALAEQRFDSAKVNALLMATMALNSAPPVETTVASLPVAATA